MKDSTSCVAIWSERGRVYHLVKSELLTFCSIKIKYSNCMWYGSEDIPLDKNLCKRCEKEILKDAKNKKTPQKESPQ